jgi:uncharacterized RDD family membrane protein YckC
MTPTKLCPECSKAELEPSGTCPACGFMEPQDPSPVTEHRPIAGLIEMDYSVSEETKPEIPEWRQELSRRLQEIKTRRESPGAPAPAPGTGTADKPGPSSARDFAPSEKVPEPDRRPRRSPRTPRAIARPEPPAVDPVETSLPLFRPVTPNITAAPQPEPARRSSLETGAIEALIDRVVARQTAQAPPPAASSILQLSLEPAHQHIRRPPPAPTARLILLSRTLAGLVDLIIVVFCAAGLIIAADVISGVEVLDGLSLVNYGVLLIATFYVYSAFFLFTAGQTIGMMITELKLADEEERRPRISQILLRCVLYTVSLLALGLGLLWGCFDRDARCAHDRLSGTRVIRISSL